MGFYKMERQEPRKDYEEETLKSYMINEEWDKYSQYAKELSSQEINEVVAEIAKDCSNLKINVLSLNLHHVVQWLEEGAEE